LLFFPLISQLESERKSFSEERILKEKKIEELEEELSRFKNKNTARGSQQAKQNVPQNHIQIPGSGTIVYTPYPPSSRKDTFSYFFGFLFASNTITLQAPVLNV
jgi:hypothetical protein